MEYTYLPNSVKKDMYEEDELVKLQVKYREQLEKRIKNYIDFSEMDKEIRKVLNVPVPEDREYNFYHKFSSLGSDYIYLRNNFHIENLSPDEELMLLGGKTDDNYMKETISRVIFEEGDKAFYGAPTLSKLADCHGLVFEFAYNQWEVKDVDDMRKIDKIVEEVRKYLQSRLTDKFNMPVSLIANEGAVDLYNPEWKEEGMII